MLKRICKKQVGVVRYGQILLLLFFISNYFYYYYNYYEFMHKVQHLTLVPNSSLTQKAMFVPAWFSSEELGYQGRPLG